MKFSEKLQSLRKGKGLSQEKLAELLDVSRQAVSKWESGQTYPEIEKLIILCDLFEITLDELVRDRGSMVNDTVIKEINLEDKSSNEYEEKDENKETGENKELDKNEEKDELIILGGFIAGTAIGLLTNNFMLGTVVAFLGLGLSYIIKGIKI